MISTIWIIACESEGPAIQAKPQQISFNEPPVVGANQNSAVVSAHSSSGLPITYGSQTPDICSVDAKSGVVTGTASGTCTIVADQLGNSEFGPAIPVSQSLHFQFSETPTTGGVDTDAPAADTITTYKVVAVFEEPDTAPNNTIFVGTYALNSATGAVSNLRGKLSEAMTGGSVPYPNDSMNWLELNFQLSAIPTSVSGNSAILVTTFRLDTTNTLSNDPAYGGTDGWTPGTGSYRYYGYPAANPGNAYVRILVNPTNPLAELSQAQIDTLAYADCSPRGLMGSTCMTGTSIAGYGAIGAMSGYPRSQITERQ